MNRPLLRLLVAVSLLPLTIINTHAIELRYKSADGDLSIEGIDDKKPYYLANGTKKYLSPQGIFEIEGELDEILNVAYIPIIGSRTYSFEKNVNHTSMDEQFLQQYKSVFRIATIDTPRPNQQILTHSPMFSQLDEIWGKEKIPDRFLLLCAWIDPSKANHQISKQYFIDTATLDKILQIDSSLSFQKTSSKKLIPVFLMLNPNGAFIPLTSSQANDHWKKIAAHLIRDDSQSLSSYLKQNNVPNSSKFLGSAIIHWASFFGSSNCLDTLLQNEIDLDLKTFANSRALHIATSLGNHTIVERLLNAGAKASPKDKYDNTPLHYAATFNQAECAETLLSHKSKKSSKNKDGVPPIFLAGKHDNANIIQLLENYGAKFKFSKENRQILLIRAIKRNELDSVEYLLSKGSQPDEPAYGVYPLFAAANGASGEIVKMLVLEGAKIDVLGKNETTPLMWASKNNYDAVVALVEAGADVNAKASDGTTALHIAILNHQIETTQYLLDHGADPNSKNDKGAAPFWLATQVGNRIGLNELISAGAICSMTPEAALPIMEYAFRHNIPEIVDITLSECIDPAFKFNNDISSYWVANYYGYEEILNIYHNKGLKPEDLVAPSFANAKEVRSQIKLVNREDLYYPRELQEIYGEFLAKIKVIIDYDGSVIFPKIVSNPVKELDRAILETINKWKFQPIVKDGKAVRTIINLPWKVTPAPPQENVFEIAEVDFKPRPIRQVAPRYPSKLKSSKVNGAVTVVFVVDKEGNVINPKAEAASHNEFIKPAITAIAQWKFSPAYVGGEKVNVRVKAPLAFRVQ